MQGGWAFSFPLPARIRRLAPAVSRTVRRRAGRSAGLAIRRPAGPALGRPILRRSSPGRLLLELHADALQAEDPSSEVFPPVIPGRVYRGDDRREKGSPPVAERASVCFVAPMAYGALSRREDLPHVGGAERQQVLLSEELVQRGYRVSFVVLDHGQPDGEEIRGIRVFKCYRADVGVHGLRFFHPRLSGLWNAMKRADADVYYQRGAEAETGLVGRWCRRHARGFIFAVA